MNLSPSLIGILAGTTGAMGVIALIAYFFVAQKISALKSAEFASVRTIVEGNGLFNADQVIRILKQFRTDESRLSALQSLASVQANTEDSARLIYGKIKNSINVLEVQKDRYAHVRGLSKYTATFFVAISIISTTYVIITRNIDIDTTSPPPSSNQPISVHQLPPPPLTPDRPVEGPWDVELRCPDNSSVREPNTQFGFGRFARAFNYGDGIKGTTELSMGYISDNQISLKGYIAFYDTQVYNVGASGYKTNETTFSGTGHFGSTENCSFTATIKQ